MVKRRNSQLAENAINQLTQEQVEAFAAAADGGATCAMVGSKDELDPNANRDFKAIRVPFNEFEYSKLEEVAKKTGRTKLNAIRWAILKLSESSC